MNPRLNLVGKRVRSENEIEKIGKSIEFDPKLNDLPMIRLNEREGRTRVCCKILG